MEKQDTKHHSKNTKQLLYYFMRTIKTIAIPHPCEQSWQQMTPNDTGRHCGQCSKTVTDFTSMNNNEIIEYFSVTKNTCGRFDGNQLITLNDRLYSDSLQTNNIWKRTVLIAGLVSQFSFFKAHSQTKPATVQEPVDMAAKPQVNDIVMGKIIAPLPAAFKSIHGTITDETNSGIPGATVKIPGSIFSAVSGKDGKFIILVPFNSTHFTASCIGYDTQTVAIYPNKLDNYKVKFNAQQHLLLGEVVVIRHPFDKRIYYRFIKRPIKKLFN